MRIELTDQELDYIARLLLQRPMGEVEPIVVNLRMQIAKQKTVTTIQKAANEAPEIEDEDDLR